MPRTRNSNPCDACQLQHIKCEEKRPCYGCRSRGIECTTLRVRKKRGPRNGPRSSTKAKIEEFQRSIRDGDREQSASTTDSRPAYGEEESSSSTGTSTSTSAAAVADCQAAVRSRTTEVPGRISVDDYRRFISIFRKRAYPVWPVVNCDGLLSKILANDQDYESWALGAALCAATIAQLRLPEHTEANHMASSHHFVRDCLRFRHLYDFRESYSLASIMTPFFLHMYYANADKLRTAAYFLREAITFVQGMELGRPETYNHLEKRERSLRLRIYWILVVTERTFSAQNGLPVVLPTISTMPDIDESGGESHLMHAFMSLTQLFSYLDGNITESSSSDQQPLERQKLVSYQADLCLDSHGAASDEAQRVDLFVTRQWIRLLVWEYTARHFAMSCYPDDPAFSLFLPVKIGHEMLSTFSLVNNEAIKPHGYGMELKVFRLADAMLDIVQCAPWSARGDGMLVGSGDILYSLQCVLLAVGGKRSTFLGKMQDRMTQLELNSGSWPYLSIPSPSDDSSKSSPSSKTGSSPEEHVFYGPRIEEVDW